MSTFFNATAPAESNTTQSTTKPQQPQQPIDLSHYFTKPLPTPSTTKQTPITSPSSTVNDLSAYFSKSPGAGFSGNSDTTSHTQVNNNNNNNKSNSNITSSRNNNNIPQSLLAPTRLRSMQSNTQTPTSTSPIELDKNDEDDTKKNLGNKISKLFQPQQPQQQPFFGNDNTTTSITKPSNIPSVESFLNQPNSQHTALSGGLGGINNDHTQLTPHQQQLQQQQQQLQLNQNPLQTLSNYSQAVQMTINAFQSVSTSALTLIQALLMFKHELCALLFGPNQHSSSNNNNSTTLKAQPTLFQTLITRPLSLLFKTAITAIDWVVRILTANLFGIKGLFYNTHKNNNQINPLHHLNNHLPYPYSTLNQSQLTNHTIAGFNSATASLSTANGPIVANLALDIDAKPFQQQQIRQKSSSFFSFTNLLYYTTTALGLYIFYKQSPIWLKSLEKRYNLVSMASMGNVSKGNNANIYHTLSPFDYYDYKTPLINEINNLAASTPLNAIKIDDVMMKLNQYQTRHGAYIDFLQIDRKIQLRLLQKYNKIHPMMYNYYSQNPEIALSGDIIKQLDKIVFPQVDSSSNNSNEENKNNELQLQHTTPSSPEVTFTLPPLFEHVDSSIIDSNTTQVTSSSLTPSSNHNIDNHKGKQITLPQVAPVVFESDGIIFSIDQLTGQVATTRSHNVSKPVLSSLHDHPIQTKTKKCLKNDGKK